MADPLSVSASIAGIISLADIVFRRVFHYARAAAGAKDEIQALSTEIHDLGGVLRNLDALCRTLETEPNQCFDPSLRLHCFFQIQDTFDKIEKRLKKSTEAFNKRAKLIELREKLKWPFSSSETKDLLAKLSRYKETLTLAASVDTINELQLVLTKQVEQGQKIDHLDRKLDAFQACVEIPIKIMLDDRKRNVLDFFLKPETNPQINLDQSIKLRHPTTGRWLSNDETYRDWLDRPGSRLWLNGLAGGGKTILAGAVIQDALSASSADVGVAFFFCDYKMEATLTPVNILGGLASQIARQRDEFFDLLQEYYEELHPFRGLDKQADADELRARLCSMAEELKNLIVVVDGIDECGDRTPDVLEMLVELADTADNVTIALFSRHEVVIQDYLQSFDQIPIAAHTEDLRDYVRAELEQRTHSGRLSLNNLDLKNEIGEELVRRAHGMFRWVVCQLDYLCEFSTDDDRREALKELPPTLHESYTRLLVRINRRPLKVRKMVQLCLHFIAFFPWGLSIQELCQAVSVPEGTSVTLSESRMVSERDILRECSSLIRISADSKGFEFAHFTVQEFLQDSSLLKTPDLEGFHISKTESNLILATQCVKFLQLRNFDRQPSETKEWWKYKFERTTSYPFYDKAAIAWPILSRERLEGEELLDAVKSLFHPFRTSFFLSWAETLIDYVMEGMEMGIASWQQLQTRFDSTLQGRYSPVEIIGSGIKPLHLSAILNIPEITAFLLSKEVKTIVHAKSRLGTPLYLAKASILGIPIRFNDDNESFSFNADLCAVSRRRVDTISYLTNAGADLAMPPDNSEIFCKASIISFHLKSFDSSLQLLKAGFVPSDDDIWEFASFLSSINPKEEDHELELSFHKILEYLKNSHAYNSTWGLELGKCLWSACVESNFSFTKLPELTDTRISLSEETLIDTIFAAIKIDDVERLQVCLQDPRASITDNGHGSTWLHDAVWESALHCTRLLLSLKSNPSARDYDGQSPVHGCRRLDDVEILKLLVEYNTDVFSQDDSGRNVWHHYAVGSYFHVSILDIFLKIDMKREHSSLLVEDDDGFTPLELCFGEHSKEEDLVWFIGYCDKIPNFWQDHRCVFPIAARKGYKKVLKKLMDLNVTPKTIGPSEMSPLHGLGPKSDLETVTVLKTLYPAAYQLRVGRHTPLEYYLNNILCGPECKLSDEVFIPDKDIIHSLYWKPLSESGQIGRTELWSYMCKLLTRFIHARTLCTWHCYGNHDQVIGKSIIEVMIDLGAMEDYESQVALPGVKLLFEAFLLAVKSHSGRIIFGTQDYIAMNTTKQAINSSQYWEPNSPWAIEFLREVIMCKDLATVEYLLDSGLDLHQRLGKETTIEYVCSGSNAWRLCESEKGMAVFQCLLDRSNPEKLKDWDYKGLSLLHRVETQSYEPGLHWLINKLVEMGLDTNGFNSSPGIAINDRDPPLFYHLNQGSLFCASVLLELGADPNLIIPGSYGWNSIMLAAFRGYTFVLNAALASSKKSGLKIRWEAPFTMNSISTKDSQQEENCTAIHAACVTGHLECVKFFNEQSLLSIECLNSSEKTPLHFCANQGFPGIIKYLVAAGARIDSKDVNGDTPLHLAAREGQIETVKLLVELGATDGINKRFKSPALLASEFDHPEIAQFLMQEFGKRSYHEPHQISVMSQIQEKTLLGKLYPAIENGNIERCRLLLTKKCPLNVQISPYNCNPLQYSIFKNQPEIAKMFLDHGASTLSNAWIIKNEYLAHCNHSITVSAFSGEMCLPLLPNILSRFLEEGGDFLQLADSLGPIPRALRSRNIQGVRTILDFLSENLDQISRRSQLEPQEVVPSILNKRYDFNQDGWLLTPLHFATYYDLAESMQLLLENGANPDTLDSHGGSPLDLVRSSSAAQLLIEWNISISPAMAIANMGIISERLVFVIKPKSTASTSQNAFKIILNHVLRRSLSCQPYYQASIGVKNWGFVQSLELMGVSLQDEKLGDTSLINALLQDHHRQEYFLNSPHLLDRLEPFNWQLLATGHIPPFLKRLFRHYSRRLSQDDFQRWANLQPEKGWSPLCRAAVFGDVVCVKNCLSLGAEVDFEGSPLGSALMAASTCGQLEAVKVLVKHGSAISYTGKEGTMSALSVARSKTVRRFLLVGQFQRPRGIGDADPRNNSWDDKNLKFWSGIAQARLRLDPMMQVPEMSRLEYAIALARIKLDMRGQIASIIDGVQCCWSDGSIAMIKNAGPKIYWE
ncbi:unnamed protein product [Clonostachys rhizophaga]|uniref:Nephrocystin 3-like N-terminal domain-containing protein n=1 Tax=Clonostachys rhizophaga TaxID=160324 RepID=A0A9N9VQ83_9HYPO|nr:unnamed protein product [Clonostachys rhizophaga]